MARMLLSVLSGCLAFLVAGGGILFLGWLLWWLWSRQQQENDAAVEIELDSTGVVAVATHPVASLEEEALPAPEERELLPEPEEKELLPEPEEKAPAAVPPQPIPAADIEDPGGPDDLRVIEGIGPRIAGVLRAGGIRTFRDLADADVAHIEDILRAEDPRLLRLARPETWPEQAALAAAGDWDGLQTLTGTLKRGRRV